MYFVLLELVVSFLLNSMRALSGARSRLHYDRILLEPHPKCRSQFSRSSIARSGELSHVEARPQQGHANGQKKILFLYNNPRLSPFFYSAANKLTYLYNKVCERRVDLLVCSLPLHRHSYIGFILAFASSIHNKQQTRRFISFRFILS
jgi:hypothetical protein